MDIKLQMVNGFKMIHLTEREHWACDSNPKDVCVGLLVSKPKNEIFLKCINKIVENCENRFYGNGPLEPTGPVLLGSFFSNEEKENMKIQLRIIDWDKNIIGCLYDGIYINLYYPDYREEQLINQNTPYYETLWEEKNIYG